jgi:hypothetical protein
MSHSDVLFGFGLAQGSHKFLRIHFVSKSDEKHPLAIGWNSVISRINYDRRQHLVFRRYTIQSSFDQVPSAFAQNSRDIFCYKELWLDFRNMLEKLHEKIVSWITSIALPDYTKTLARWPANYAVNPFAFGLS